MKKSHDSKFKSRETSEVLNRELFICHPLRERKKSSCILSLL